MYFKPIEDDGFSKHPPGLVCSLWHFPSVILSTKFMESHYWSS